MRLWHIDLIPGTSTSAVNGGWTFRCKEGLLWKCIIYYTSLLKKNKKNIKK